MVAWGLVAQLVEHLIEAQGVGGSNPSESTIRVVAQVVAHRFWVPRVAGSSPVYSTIGKVPEWLTEQIANLSTRRSLPGFESQSFRTLVQYLRLFTHNERPFLLNKYIVYVKQRSRNQQQTVILEV